MLNKKAEGFNNMNMEMKIDKLIKRIRTREELVFFLEEIAGRKLELEKEEISELEKKLRSLPEISLEIAFSPNDNFIDRISCWLEKELGKKIILDITVNPKVTAGAVIEYRGNWRDFSLAKEINRLLAEKSTDSRDNNPKR